MILLVIDIIIVIYACLHLGFVIPVFGEMFSAFGVRMPPATQFFLNLSNVVMAFHGVGLVLLIFLLTFVVIRMYCALHQRGEKKTLFMRLWFILAGVFILVVIMTVSMFQPMFHIDQGIVSGPTTESNQVSQDIGKETEPKPER